MSDGSNHSSLPELSEDPALLATAGVRWGPAGGHRPHSALPATPGDGTVVPGGSGPPLAVAHPVRGQHILMLWTVARP